jgi:hypothetical protein
MFDLFDLLFKIFNIGMAVNGICVSRGIRVSQALIVKDNKRFNILMKNYSLSARDKMILSRRSSKQHPVANDTFHLR